MIAILKKILSVLMVILMVLTAVPLSAFGGLNWSDLLPGVDNTRELDKTGQCGDNVYWNYDSVTGELFISGIGPIIDYDGYNESPFCRTEIKSVVIEDGVTSVGNKAFFSCESLIGITIPDSVTTIGDSSFERTSIFDVTIPDSVRSIGSHAFRDCENLTSITIPNSVTTIGDCAFYWCENLVSITIPDSVKLIGSSVVENTAFYNNDSNWVDNALYIGKHLIDVQQTISGECNITDGTLTVAGGAFAGCTELTGVTIPDSVTTIGSSIFEGCTSLLDLELTENISYIGNSIVWNCKSLSEITVDKDNLYYASNEHGVLFNKDMTELIQYPIGKENSSYNIPYGVTKISDSAFYGSENLTDINFSGTEKIIDIYAFGYCSKISNVIIPDSVTDIVEKAFNGSSVENVILSDNMTKITYASFANCDNLKSITIPKSITLVEEYSFDWSNNLESVYYEGSEEEWKKVEILEGNDPLLNAKIYFMDIHTHSFTKYISDGNATCTTNGTKTAYCDYGCGETDTIEDEILVEHDLYESDCIKSTCTQEGKIIYTCKNCDYSEEETLSLEKHNYYEAETVESTCVQEGAVVYKCKDCTDSYEEKLPLGKHDMYEADCIKSTCTQEGKIIYNCKNCDYSEEYKLSLEKHNYYEAEYIEPTCTKEGKYVYKCTNCTDSYEKVVSPCHIYYEAEYIEQTCTKEGKIVYKCKYCSESYEKILSACHIYYETERIEPTCTKDGKVVNKCKNCSEFYEVILKAGHTFVEPEYVAPTCTVDGKRSGTCQSCGIYVSETVPAIGHKWTVFSCKAATCTTDGEQTDVCLNCGKMSEVKIIKAGHSFGKWVMVKEATCTVEGKKERYCMIAGCSATEELIIAKLGHTFSDWVVDGDVATRTCKTCNFTETSSEPQLTGQCGDNVYWKLDVITGKLTIYGVGPTWDYGDYWGVYSPFVYLNIKSAVIENGVTTIGTNLFYGAQELKSISLPDSVIEFRDAAFYECKVENINIPSNLKSIGAEAFYGASMSSIEIPESVEYIGDAAFFKCANLKLITIDNNNKNYSNDEYGVLFNKDKTILIQYPLGRTANTYSIPDGVTTVKFGAFYTPIHLENIGIPDSLVVVEDLGLACRSVKCVCYRGTQAQWEEIFYNSYNPLQEANFHYVKENNFSNYTNDNNATCTTDETKTAYCGVCGAKDTVKIENTALGHTFSDWVVDGDIATRTCQTCNLTETSSEPQLTGQCGDNVYWTFNVITGELVISGSGDMWDFEPSYDEENPFNKLKINTIKVEDGVTTIGANSFHNHDYLTSVSLPESLTVIGDGAFWESDSLTHINMPSNLKIIGYGAIKGTSVKSVEIPESVESIGKWAFDKCQNLEKITVDENNKHYSNDENGVLFNKDKTVLIQYPLGNSTKSYTVPDGVTTIKEFAFANCLILESVIIPDSVTSIGEESLFGSIKYVCYEGTQKQWEEITDDVVYGSWMLTNFHYIADRNFSNYINDGNATCTTNETKTAYCPACGAKDTVEIENTALGHDYYVKERIEATCTLEGKVVFECKRCKVTYEEAADKLEHKWNEGYKIVTQPTCTQEGIEAIVCTVCDSAKEGSERSIEKLPHKFTDWSTEGNKSTRYCEVCNYTETKINTDGGDIEIEAPEQSDGTDFVVDEIVTGGKDYVVIEEAVSNGTDNSWEVIKAFDINLKNHDGVHVQPNGTVKVKLPNDWSKNGNYKVYRVNDDGTLTDMNAYRQGSHLVFDTDHFSIYVIVGESEKTDTPDEPEVPTSPEEPENPSDNCSCKCHKTGFFAKIIWKITIFFNKLFKKNQVCSCGVNHY